MILQNNIFFKYINLLTRVKLLSKRMFYSSENKSAANDSQQTSKTLQNLSTKNPSERTLVSKNLLVDELLIIDDTNIIIINFNDIFTGIGIKLAQTHGVTEFNTISKFLSKCVDSSVYLNPHSPTKILM